MAIDMKDNGTVGCAYYVAIDEALFLQEDIPLAGMELVETLLLHVEPTTVLISIRSPDNLVHFIEAGAQDFQGHRNQDEGQYLPFSICAITLIPSRRDSWCLYIANLGFSRVQL